MIITYIVDKFLNLLYRQFAFFYDAVAFLVSWGAWKEWVRSVSQYIIGDKILELGFGTGTLLTHLAKRNFIVVGLDLSRQMIKISRKRLENLSTQPVIRLIRASATQLPIYSNCFDSVVATFPSNYIFHPDTLSGIKRVLKMKGQLVILLSAEPHKSSLPGKFLAWLFSVTGQSYPDNDDRFDIIKNIMEVSDFDCEIVKAPAKHANLVILKAFPSKKYSL